MKQSELKKQLEKEAKIKREEFDKFWANFNKEPKTYKNLICKNIKYTPGFTRGHNPDGVFTMLWHCDKCGRNGCHYDKNTIRKIDKFIEEKCDLKEG